MNQAAVERRIKKLLGDATRSGMFNPKAKLDTSQVIDLRGELVKLLVPAAKRTGTTPVGLGKYYKSKR